MPQVASGTSQIAEAEVEAVPMEVANALSKITEKESLIPTVSVIPESTKVISNLFGRLSKFTAMHQRPLIEDQDQIHDQEDLMENTKVERIMQ